MKALRPLLFGATLLALAMPAACRPARPVDGGPAPSRSVRVQLSGDGCPVGFLRVWYAREGGDGHAREAKSDADGNATLDVEPGTYRADLVACGRAGGFTFDGKTATVISYRLPAGSESPSSPHEAWSSKPAAPRARCRFPATAARELLVTGSYTDLRLDEGRCGIFMRAQGAEWLMTPDRSVHLMGSVVARSGEKVVIVADSSGAVVSVDRATGVRSVVATSRRRVALTPHTEVLLLSDDDPQTGTMKLDARWPDGRERHLSDRARTELAWSNDGRWLAFLDDAKKDDCPTLHVVDAVRADDRALFRVCKIPGWGLPRFVSDKHVFISGEAGSFVLDASTGATSIHVAPGSWVTPFAGGVLVQEGREVPPERASVWNASTGRSFALPFRIDLVRELPTGDLVVFRRRRDPSFVRGDESPYDAIFVDTTTGAARLIAEGVMNSMSASPSGLIVLKEDARFVALAMGASTASAFPSEQETVESFSDDGRWVGLRGPRMKGRTMWHATARVDGKGIPARSFDDPVQVQWVHDRSAFVFRERDLPSGPFKDLGVRWGDGGRTVTIAKNVDSYVLLDEGQIVYAVSGGGGGEGLYVEQLDGS